MNVVVVGVLALASALVRERGDLLEDWHTRRAEPSVVMLPRIVEGDVVGPGPGVPTDVVARESADTASSSEAPSESVSESAVASSDASSPSGQWEIACEIKNGSALVFDRGSLREYGQVTLVRWSAPRARLAAPGEQIFTAVVNCREKTIEAAWPGRSRETRVGTCGRGLVEAVCAAAGQAAAPGRGRRAIEPSTSRVAPPRH
jgi:hypothetical protein